MIENVQQYEITQEWAGRFREAYNKLRTMPRPSDEDQALLFDLQADTYLGQAEELEYEMALWEQSQRSKEINDDGRSQRR